MAEIGAKMGIMNAIITAMVFMVAKSKTKMVVMNAKMPVMNAMMAIMISKFQKMNS